jgi:hypothetical protein
LFEKYSRRGRRYLVSTPRKLLLFAIGCPEQDLTLEKPNLIFLLTFVHGFSPQTGTQIFSVHTPMYIVDLAGRKLHKDGR